MKKILRFLIKKILKIILYIILGIFLVWFGLFLFVLGYCLTENIGNSAVREMPHEDAWVYKPPEPIDWHVVNLNFDPKDWGIPVIWAPENQK